MANPQGKGMPNKTKDNQACKQLNTQQPKPNKQRDKKLARQPETEHDKERQGLQNDSKRTKQRAAKPQTQDNTCQIWLQRHNHT